MNGNYRHTNTNYGTVFIHVASFGGQGVAVLQVPTPPYSII